MILNRTLEQRNPRADEAAAVVKGASADQVAVDDAGSVDEGATGYLKIKSALGHGRHLAALHTAGVGRNLNAVADTGHRLVFGKEMPGDADEILVVADVLRRPATTEKYADIVGWIDLGKGMVCPDLIALPFPGDRPAGTNLVQHHLIGPLFRRNDDWAKPRLLESKKRIERVDGLGCIADYDQDARAIIRGVGHLNSFWVS